MSYIMFNAPDALNSKLAGIIADLARLGVEASYDEILAYVLEEGADVVAPEVCKRAERKRFLDSFEKSDR